MASSSDDSSPVNQLHFVIQDDCYKHLYRRSNNLDLVFERPQRLRFVNLGLATALAWHQSTNPIECHQPAAISDAPGPFALISSPKLIVSRSTRRISTSDPAVQVIHASPEQLIPSPSAFPAADPHPSLSDQASYLDHLVRLCRQAHIHHQLGRSEIPKHLPPGDLYLSTGTEYAVLGAVGACYDALDSIFRLKSQTTKSFVNIRPPGHHCTPTEPMGFCWLNNILVACMHAHLTYDIDRICILDIDLHHGNGSQQIVWDLNASIGSKLKLSYSSIHDLNSYPCEDGDPEKIRDACVNVCQAQSVNQFIQNIHLEHWTDEADFFDRLYPSFWNRLQAHMLTFLTLTHAEPGRTMIFVSAGFDACEHETESMSRYGMKLPTAFYHRFARDLGAFANAHASGRILSVLEGGYSERTLVASSLSYILGLLASEKPEIKEEIEPAWAPELVTQVSDGVLRQSSYATDDELVGRIKKIFGHLDGFERARAELRAETRKAAKMGLQVPPPVADTTGRMRLRSGRLASGTGGEKADTVVVTTTTGSTTTSADSSIEGMFEKLSIAHPKTTEEGGNRESQDAGPVKAELKEAQSEPEALQKSIKTEEPAKEESGQAKPQRLKLVWKSEGLNG
ncbi:hypothetical protein CROQUDRAFT_665220 [Cronartium quercuum f. sp. fusiforme G11]|uniref:Histone deacetylase domain-containing protein n=1 Tax=Cronartium quercuum f. sp. fusiforme G11 TaxID=708437 RepID=A0A9P6N6D2_9BASI|nr:hypothetical protein CROQUDRAFT_665220 [Cronartium quercuum f. sp. fusiforme G11]